MFLSIFFLTETFIYQYNLSILNEVIHNMKLFKDKRANMDMLSGIAIGLLALVIIFSIVMTVGPKLEDVAAVDSPAYATGTLTFSGNVVDGETVTIGDITYEFNASGAAPVGDNVEVPMFSGLTPAIATVNLTAAVNGNATSSAILTAASTATTVVLTYDTQTAGANTVATTTTLTNAVFGAATLLGGVADAGWSSSAIPTPASVWSDNATFLSLAAMVIIISLLMFYVFRMRGAGGGGGI
jgi:hypothetical protein